MAEVKGGGSSAVSCGHRAGRGANILISEPISVHELNKFVLSVVFEDLGDVVILRCHVAELIVGAVAEVGPGFRRRG